MLRGAVKTSSHPNRASELREPILWFINNVFEYWTYKMKIKVPYFDDVEVDLSDEVSRSDPTLIEFLRRNSNDRLKDSLHVFNYYRDFHHAVGGEDWLDQEMGIVSDPKQIWMHVTPGPVFIEGGTSPDTSRYVVMEAECAWEVEHGLMMVWKDGKVLCKVGGYDGHVTNADAYADDTLQNIVYSAGNQKFTTINDG